MMQLHLGIITNISVLISFSHSPNMATHFADMYNVHVESWRCIHTRRE